MPVWASTVCGYGQLRPNPQKALPGTFCWQAVGYPSAAKPSSVLLDGVHSAINAPVVRGPTSASRRRAALSGLVGCRDLLAVDEAGEIYSAAELFGMKAWRFC